MFRIFIPRYDELTLFVMSLTCILIFVVNIDVIRGADFSLSKGELRPLILMAVFSSGLILSFFHAFTKQRKTVVEKFLMVFFAVIVNAASGITGGAYALENSDGYLAIFPILNIVNGVMLVFLLRANIINENSVSEEDVGISAIALGSTVAVIVFFICQYVMKLYWASTFSLCVAYATNLNRVVVNIFFRQEKQE